MDDDNVTFFINCPFADAGLAFISGSRTETGLSGASLDSSSASKSKLYIYVK